MKRTLSTSKNDGDFSRLPQREINEILAEWSRQRALGVPAQQRLQALLTVLKSERLGGEA